MNRPIVRRLAAAVFAVIVALSTAWASNRTMLFKFEMTASYAWENPRLNSTYLNSYSPPFSPGAFQSSASQTLVFKGERSHGYGASLRFFPIPYAGVEVLYDAFKANLSGANSDYKISLRYTARLPPDYIPVEFDYAREDPWPATEGEFKESVFSLNAAARIPLGRFMTFNVSAGASFCHFEAQSASIAYTQFWLGGHSVLFLQDYRLALSWGPTRITGANIGGELTVGLFSNIGLAAEIRYFSFPETAVEWRIQTGEEISETPEELAQLMNLGSIKVDPSLWRASLGLRFLF
jgi:hypothetical protein